MCGEYNYRLELATLWTEAVLYGFYVMLFAGSIYITIWQRPNTRYLIITILLFAFVTVAVVAELLRVLLTPKIITSSIPEGGGLVSCIGSEIPARHHDVIISNSFAALKGGADSALFFVADLLLINRCFALWGNKKRVVALPLVLLLTTTVCNIMDLYYDCRVVILQRNHFPNVQTIETLIARANIAGNIGNWLSLAINVITTFLAALRIWRMTGEIKTALGPGSAVRYYSAIAMLIESGAFVSTPIFVDSIIAVVLNNLPIQIVASAITNLFLAIAPTLIIVRVGMGKGFDSVQDSLHASHVANSRAPASHQLALRERGTSTVSGIRFRSVQEAESTTSRLDNSDDNGGAQDLSIVEKSERHPAESGAMV